MNILVACEESQAVCCAFRNLGHNAFSCDILSCSGGHPEWHIHSDVLPLLNGFCDFHTADGTYHMLFAKWDLIIAFPPCTYLTKAGARWMYPSKGIIDNSRFALSLKAREFFLAILNADCEHICVENPTPLKCTNLPPASQKIQPYLFGHPYSKLTLLWLKGLPPLVPTHFITLHEPFIASNTSNYSKGLGKGSYGVAFSASSRSKTFSGIAAAMAEQWSAYLSA